MDLQIKRNSGIVKLEVTLLSPEIERIINSEMSNFERSEFVRLWNGNLMEKFRDLSMVIRMSEINEKAGFIKDMTN
jgi:hypothetical protein